MQPLLDAIRRNPEIVAAAVTGSRARPSAADQYSDWDILVIARDVRLVRDVRCWLPPEPRILLCAFHLTNYCSILLETFDKIDLAIFSIDDPPSRWVVHDYQAVKGGPEFEAQLTAAADETRSKRAVHLNPDVSLDNVLLLLATAAKRERRGERLSAHAFLAMAADMVVSFERRASSAVADADLLDPRRRLEGSNPELAAVLHDSLFGPPERGIRALSAYVAGQRGGVLTPEQRQVAQKLLS